MREIKELNSWAVGGNTFHPEEGYSVTLYNEDENGNETDTVFINLSPERLRGMIESLEYVLSGGCTVTRRNEYEEPIEFYVCGVRFESSCRYCPSIFTAFDTGNGQSGCVRFSRRGIYAECPDFGGERIYEVDVNRDKSFYTEAELKHHLTKIAEQILEWRERSNL